MTALLRNVGALDLRALGLLRIGVGILVAADVFSRIGMVREHYSDEGILPSAAWHGIYRHASTWSLHLLHGEVWFQLLLMILALVAAVCLVLGVRARFATALAWILTVSIQSRNPGLCHGGDVELRMILFWGFFLPWDRYYALGGDLTRDASQAPHRMWSLASLAYSVQIALVYFASALMKTGPHWRQDFTAVFYTLNIGAFARPQGLWLAEQFAVTKALTFATLVFEFAAPFLLLASGTWWRVRLAVVAGFVALHLGFFAFLQLSTFPLVCIVSMIAFLPAQVFDARRSRVAAALRSVDARVQRLAQTLRQRSASVVRWLVFKPVPRPPAVRALGTVIVAASFFYVLAWNVATVSGQRIVPKMLYPMGRALGLHQTWGMFINKNSGSYWVVTVARTADGTEVDLLTDRPPRWERPKDISQLFGDFRTGRHLAGLSRKQSWRQQVAYTRYLCAEMSRRHSPAETVQVWFAHQQTPLPGHQRPSAHRRMLIEKACPDPAN